MSESIHVDPSGKPNRPNRVTLPDRTPVDLTDDELVALQHEIRRHMLYPVPATTDRPAVSGG
ncbi:hypothetical protein [Embleya sp. NPDC050493]|uniref:hypothetical protein n=1 Tax=Embleya sp. NPDC050493 TaxID=3363989 RepID=UPI003798185C